MDETVLFNRYGKSAYRLCGSVFYDFMGKPRGFLSGTTVYDLRCQHRGFYIRGVIWDRMGRVVGYTEGGTSNGLQLPPVEIPPVPYKNLPPPDPLPECVEVQHPTLVPAWSMMRLENLLV